MTANRPDGPTGNGPVAAPAPQTGWRTWLAPAWLGSALAFLLVYVLVNLLYGISTTRPEMLPLDASTRAVVYLNPIGLTPAEDRVKVKVVVDPPDTLVQNGALTQPLSVHLASVPKTLTFDVGSKVWGSEVDFVAEYGSYEMYPLDRYEEGIAVSATTSTPDGTEQAVPNDVVIWGKFPGWRVESTTSRDPLPEGWELGPEVQAAITESEVSLAVLTVTRNGSTMSIVVLWLTAMVVLAALALVVARAVATRRRRIEATMASWFAALLFAMVPLRTNLPGAPPIGVWIDFLVFLWVILGLMVALALFIGSWLRYTAPPEPPTPPVKSS